jgi:hypothetical protein
VAAAFVVSSVGISGSTPAPAPHHGHGAAPAASTGR